MEIQRLDCNPIITPETDDSIGTNINGPSLIKVPDWVEEPLGKYYLYFAHHSGKFIRLAYANNLEGPWKVYKPGALKLEDSYCGGHIASPDVHIDNENKEIIMFFHGGSITKGEHESYQKTRMAVSKDGINFIANPKVYGKAYWRNFYWNGYYYAVTMSGILYRSKRLKGEYEAGPDIFEKMQFNQRHMAVKVIDDVLYIFYSIKGDTPEHIVVSKIRLTENWKEWRVDSFESVLKPETDYEGADMPLKASKSGAINERVRQLRDPAIYDEGDESYLLYSIAGESGIAIARILDFD